MAFIVETGSVVANANSYTSIAFADDYFDTHLYYSERWAEYTITEKENMLVAATSYLDSTYDWDGTRTSDTSSLRWPRSGVMGVDDIEIGENTIPVNLQRAVCEQAVEMKISDVLAPSDTLGITELKVDVIEFVFDKNDKKSPTSSRVLILLKGLGTTTIGSRVVKVFRS
jgi:hypothetical protein